MTTKEFVAALQCCIQDEFVAVSEVNENVIRVKFVDGQLINVLITEQNKPSSC